MPHSNAIPVAVAGGDDDLQIMIGELEPGRYGERPPVQDVEPVRPNVVRKFAAAADARDDDAFMGMNLEHRQRLLYGVEDSEVAAPGAPGRLLGAIEELDVKH